MSFWYKCFSGPLDRAHIKLYVFPGERLNEAEIYVFPDTKAGWDELHNQLDRNVKF